MSLKNWNVLADSNTSAPPDGCPEGMLLSAVNNTMRQIMADVRTLAASDTLTAAATCDIGAKDATFLTVTNTTTAAIAITSFGTVSDGIYKILTFSPTDAISLTHNATSLILPNSANISCASGDVAMFRSLGSGNWRCMFYSSAASSSSLIGFTQSGTGAVARTAQDKARESVSVKDFGAVGDGVTDDTASIQSALSTTATYIKGVPGETYLIDGGLTSSVAKRVIDLSGCTIKLKASATSKGMLSLTGAGSKVVGGTWDGNKANGNIPADLYGSYNVLLNADNCVVDGITSVGTAGMAVKGGTKNGLVVRNCVISEVGLYGIYFEAVGGVSSYRNKAINNQIDVTAGGAVGQGILFTSSGGGRQYDWELSGNSIVGSSDAGIADQAICLGVRGDRGIVANNITRGGSMGFSEGGNNTVITGNSFLDLAGTIKYAIEAIGSNVTITGNHCNNALYGVMASGDLSLDGYTIAGNALICDTSAGAAIKLQPGIGFTAKDCTISGNKLVSSYGVLTIRNCTGLTVSGNTISAASSAAGRGIYINEPEDNAHVSIIGNTFTKIQRATSVYSATARVINEMYAFGNSVSNDAVNSGYWTIEGSVTLGTNVVWSWGGRDGGRKHIVNSKDDKFLLWDQTNNNPEGAVTAGVGSFVIENNSGVFIKRSGTGNTGWRGIQAASCIVNGDVAVSITNATLDFVQVWNSPLTADRAVTLGTTNIPNGMEFRIVRTAAATGAFSLNVGTGPLKALAAGQWCEVVYTASGWMLTTFGSL